MLPMNVNRVASISYTSTSGEQIFSIQNGPDKSGHSKRSDRPTVKTLTVVIGHMMDMLNFDSTEMYTMLALIVNFI